MKVTDYIVSFLEEKGINDVFGYPGGVICHFLDSVLKNDSITAHLNYHEQGAAFAACGYAQSSHKAGVAYSTSGPGATNLVTGIANAYFDSIPSIFITGQVDTYAAGAGYMIRQRGFQETNVVSMVKDIAKWAVYVEDASKIRYYLEKAYYIATEGNPGPVVLDIPADVQRADVALEELEGFCCEQDENAEKEAVITEIFTLLEAAKRPVILAGNGIKLADQTETFRKLVDKYNIPVVTSLPAFDLLPYEHVSNYGFIGTNGHRYANFILAKSDLIIVLGSRMDIRQIGLKRINFNPSAKLIRIDIDSNQLKYKVHEDEYSICADLQSVLPQLLKISDNLEYKEWITTCEYIKEKLRDYDAKDYHKLIKELSRKIPDNSIVTVDVGQHQLWVAQSFEVKKNQKVYMSAGHGAMGYAIPAGIGAYYGSKKNVFVICGDGGFMMNLQELQCILRDKLPVKIICINNSSLGMIRGFQERNFNKKYIHTTQDTGYLAPDFRGIADAFGMKYSCIHSKDDVNSLDFNSEVPELIEVKIAGETILEPNFGGGLLHDQMPQIARELFDELMEL